MSSRYKTEAEFVRFLTGKLKKECVDIQKLESHSTGVGIPDLFLQGHGQDVFVEAKNRPDRRMEESFKIPWRPGQLAWHNKYAICHKDKKHVFTICAVEDGVIIIKMTRDLVAVACWENNFSLLKNSCGLDVACFNWKQFAQLKLFKFLITGETI